MTSAGAPRSKGAHPRKAGRGTTRGAPEIARSRLFDAYEAASPRLIAIAAPAGYGKSTLARQLGARFDLVATCDCASVGSERELCYSILAALRKAQAATQPGITSQRAEAAGDPTLDNVLSLLGESIGSIALIFENAHDAFANPVLRRSLQRVVAASPRSCTTIVCARSSARLRLSKFAAPHEMVVWRARDLAFDRTEIAEVFGERGTEPEIVDEIFNATSGWPAAVLFLQRFVNRVGLRSALQRFGESDFEQLHEYLIDEVLTELTSDQFAAVLICSVVPDPTIEDVSRGLSDVPVDAVVNGLLEACPLFVRVDAERFALHSLLQVALGNRFVEQRRKLGSALAERYESEGRFVRAAQIYQAARNEDAMARALIAENTNPERTRTIGYSALLASLDEQVLRRYPVLAALTIYWRRFRVDPHGLREETELVWEALGTSSSVELRANVGATIARIMYETGAFARAETLLRGLEREFGGIPEIPATAGQAFVARTLGCIAARSGRIGEAERYFKIGFLARPGAEQVRSRYYIERALIERLADKAQDERRLLRLALESARAAHMPVQAVCALAESAFGAWFQGDDLAFRATLVRLDLEAHANGYLAFAHFCAIGSGIADVAPNGTEQPNWLACALLVAAASNAGQARSEYARAAKRAADESRDVFLQVLAAIAVALSEGADRREMLSEAAAHARRIESPVFARAVEDFAGRGSDDSMLRAFVRRFDCDAAETKPALRIEVLARKIFLGDETLDIGERQITLLLALARELRAYPRATLLEDLWPALTEVRAREALNSCVYRIRSRLGQHVIAFERDAYRLGEGVRVDLRDLERSFAVAARRTIVTAKEREMLARVVERWGVASPELSEAHEFLSPILVRAAQMVQTIAERLADDALQRGAPDDALAIARDLIANDPCDEQARHIAIRAMLVKGERSKALVELRDYQKVLWNELEVRPSAALTALLNERDAQFA